MRAVPAPEALLLELVAPALGQATLEDLLAVGPRAVLGALAQRPPGPLARELRRMAQEQAPQPAQERAAGRSPAAE